MPAASSRPADEGRASDRAQRQTGGAQPRLPEGVGPAGVQHAADVPGQRVVEAGRGTSQLEARRQRVHCSPRLAVGQEEAMRALDDQAEEAYVGVTVTRLKRP